MRIMAFNFEDKTHRNLAFEIRRKVFIEEQKVEEREEFDEWENLSVLTREVNHQDLLILINARKDTVSYHSYLNKMPGYLSKYFTQFNFIIIYPEQKSVN